MQLTFTEMHTPTVGLQIQVDRQLHTEKSDFQRIDVFECEEFGRFLTLDGYMMLTERDEFIYHEMMVHVPMAVLGRTFMSIRVETVCFLASSIAAFSSSRVLTV